MKSEAEPCVEQVHIEGVASRCAYVFIRRKIIPILRLDDVHVLDADVEGVLDGIEEGVVVEEVRASARDTWQRI